MKDLDVVRLARPVIDADGRELPIGCAGTVVSTYEDGAAFLVEFTQPRETLAEVTADDVSVTGSV